MRNFSLFLVLSTISLLFSCSTEQVQTSAPQTQSINNAKIWFEKYRTENDLKIIEYAKSIEWDNAIVSNGSRGEIIEVPYLLKDNYSSSISNAKKTNNNFHRLLFVKDGADSFKLNFIDVFTNDSFLSTKEFNYYNVPDKFIGAISVFDVKNKSAKLLHFNIDKEKRIKSTSKTQDISCLFFGEWNGGQFTAWWLVGCYSTDKYCTCEEEYGTPDEYGSSGDLNGEGGDAGASSEETSPPSCESFNFVQTGSNWQESAVKNIRFVIVVYDPPLGAYINHIIEFPQPILFGSPINLLVGNTYISKGTAAETGAEVLRISMQETVNMYGNKTVDELTVRLYFESRLKDNYSLMVPGGRVNVNATNYTVTPTEYKSTWFGTADCN